MKYNIKIDDIYCSLTVIEINIIKNGYNTIKVKCICGKEKTIIRGNFTSGKTKSCGCMRGKLISKHRTIHGDSKNCSQPGNKRLYRIWSGMKERILNPQGRDKYYYKDIEICEEWKKSYVIFKEWALKNGYKNSLTIDRIDNDKNYCPNNCRWATYKEQNLNRKPFVLKRDTKGKFTKVEDVT